MARVRAVEETDGESRIWDGGTRRTATEVASRSSGRNTLAFLAARSQELTQKTQAPLESTLSMPVIPGWLSTGGLIGAFGAGWALSAVGQEREINLLALPLMGILLWNAVVVVLCLVALLRPKSAHRTGERVEQVFRRLSVWKSPSAQDAIARLPREAPSRFMELASQLWRARLASRFRSWLHLGAALIAIGSAAGMFARGWSRDYRAVWESTLLETNGATKFLGTLFTPAAKVTGIPVPLQKLPGMQRVEGKEAQQPDSARDWICLYGATLGLLVVAPRLLLLLLEMIHARSLARRTLQGAEWQSYARRLLSMVEGDGAAALVLTHGLVADATAQDRWRQWAHAHWRDLGAMNVLQIPVAGESEFIAGWQPGTTRVMLVFNMSNVPEAEVQRSVAEGIASKLLAERPASFPLLLALDGGELRRRWSGFADSEKRLEGREASWREMMKGVPAEWVVTREGGSR